MSKELKTLSKFASRLPKHLLYSLKAAANARDVPYQLLIKVCFHEKLRSN
ncbi:MAG TPA: CopG family antitoxin [Burkholderiales bacterium]|nr:CopG family antitoxin [Burkholderiales bacterium]